MEQTSLSYKTLRNSVYSFLGFLLPIFTGIVVTRFVFKHLGVSEYGVFILANTIMAFLGYIDLGLSTAFIKFAAEYQARGDAKSLNRLAGSAQSLSLIYGFVGFLAFAVLGRWFLFLFHIPPASAQNIFIVFLLAGGVFFVNSVTMVLLGSLGAIQRYDLINKANMANLIIVSLLTIIVVALGFQLKAVMAVNVFGVCLTFLLYYYFIRKYFPAVHLQLGWDRTEIAKAYSFGMLSFVSSLASGALVFLDRLIIPLYTNPAQLSYYSLPGNVALKIPGLTNSLSVMLLPMASALQGGGEEARLQHIYTRAFRNLSVVAAAVSTGIILFANKILYFWLGADVAHYGTSILIILTFTNYLLSLYTPLAGMLLGLGKLKFLIKQSVTMAVLNLILLLALVPRFGIVGAAWAYLLSILPAFYAFYWIEHRYFSFGSRWPHYAKLYAGLLLAAAATALVTEFFLLPLASSLYALMVLGPLGVVLFFVFYYLLGFADRDDIETFKLFFGKVFKVKFG